jgi:putative endopeptidase
MRYALLLSITCLSVSAAASAGPAPTSGIDRATFDTKVRPQDDFFRWVNGGWIDRTQIPGDRSSWGSFVELIELSENRQRAILEELAAKPAAAGTLERQLGDLYASFMDEARVEAAGSKPIAPLLAEIEAIKDKAGLVRAFARLGKRGVGHPLGLYVTADWDAPERYAVYLVQDGLTLPERDWYLKDDAKFIETRQKLVAYVDDLNRLAGRNAPGAGRSVLELETRLARVYWSLTDLQDSTKVNNKVAVAALRDITDRVDWKAYLTEAGVGAAQAVSVSTPTAFAGIGPLLDEVPLATWKTWLSFKAIDAHASLLSKAFADASFGFNSRTVLGQKEQAVRWKRGVRFVNSTMGMGLGKVYAARHFPPEAKARMLRMIRNLQDQMAEDIGRLEWMTPATQAEARTKLATFKPAIGYPDKWRDYSKLVVKRDDLVGNAQRATAHEYDRTTTRLPDPVDRTEWGMLPQTVNASYNPVQNKITFPAAILQPPFFNMEADDAVNYGGIGAVIGHEIGHGYDDDGRLYDSGGRFRDWWTPADAAAFKTRADRIVAQYDAFEALPGLNLKGEMVLGEAIGDLSGLRIAYRAWQRSLGGKPSPVIDGFTGEQRFFIGLAQIWRHKANEQWLRFIVTSDEHAPPVFRVRGTLRNLDEFHRVFEVKPGDGMWLAPAERVRIW